MIELVTVFGLASLFVFLIVVGTLIKGYVLSILWLWFLVPVGLPILSLAQSIGVAMTVSWLTYQQTDYKSNGKEAWTMLFENFVLRPLTVLGVAYIVKQFI